MITAIQALANLEAVLDDAIPDEISIEIISGWVKTIAAALDERGALLQALATLVAYVENRKGHAKPYAPAMNRARAVLTENHLRGAKHE